MNVSIKTKLLAMALFLILLTLVTALIGITGIQQSNLALENVFEFNMKNTAMLNKIDGLTRATRIQMLLALQHDPKNEFSSLHEHPTSMHTDLARKNMAEILQLWKEYSERITTPKARELAGTYNSDLLKFLQDGIEAAIKSSLAGDFNESYRLTFDAINPLIQKANRSLESIIQNELDLAKSSHEQQHRKYLLFRNVVLCSLLVSIVSGLGAAFFITGSISRSSRILKNTAVQLAEGNLAVRANVESHDELGVIGESINHIADSVVDAMNRIDECSRSLNAAASELRANAEQIASGSEHVVSQAMTVATASEEMAATSNEIAGNCTMAVESANMASQAATSGADIVQQTVEGMARIAGKVKDSARTVENLGARSDQIGQIIGTIQDIADQTNLLALNAAIEAARAGEQGRGFAVVADEVRALAERTTKATREIDQMIKAIQGETRNAVTAMEEGVHEVERGTSDAASSGRALQDILAQVDHVTVQINQIATAAEEQTATTGGISHNIQRITEVVQDTAGSSQMTAEAASRLASLASELQGIVGRFRLKG